MSFPVGFWLLQIADMLLWSAGLRSPRTHDARADRTFKTHNIRARIKRIGIRGILLDLLSGVHGIKLTYLLGRSVSEPRKRNYQHANPCKPCRFGVWGSGNGKTVNPKLKPCILMHNPRETSDAPHGRPYSLRI